MPSVNTNSSATFGLLYNGLDFLLSALEHLKGTPTARDAKYGVLHLSAGTALLLKERLRRVHPSMVFEDPGAFAEADYRAGNFRSVGVTEAIKRLKKQGIAVPRSARTALRALQLDRNRLEHFGAKIEVVELAAVAASALSLAVDFVGDHLSVVTPKEEELIEQIRVALPEFTALVRERAKAIAPKLEKAQAVRTCPRCATDSLMLGDGMAECAFCTRKLEPSEAADEYVEQVLGISSYVTEKDGGEWPVHTCPDCEGEGALVAEDEGCVCFQCGQEFAGGELDHCMKCGNVYYFDGESTVCPNCFDAAVARDD